MEPVNPGQDSSLATALDSVATRMLADYRASGVVRHRGSKGTVREATFIDKYLRKYLPRNVIAAHSGEVVSVSGQVSGQCDVLVMDPSTPPLWDEDDYRLVPSECLYGVIEVKSALDSTELRKAWKQIAVVKQLPKAAYFPDFFHRTREAYGTTWPYVPTTGMIFAFDGIELDSLGETFEELADEYPPEACPDSIWILSRGYIVWTSPENGNVDPFRVPGSGYKAVSASPSNLLCS
jgi:hypothetical protein